MIRRSLVKHGNTWALVLDKTMREAIGIDVSGPKRPEVHLTFKGETIVIKLAKDAVWASDL
jgi:hypothetical protein